MGIIYKAVNNINGDSYIGQTIGSFQVRKNTHKYEAENDYYDIHFHRAIRKYGFDNFEWKIIEEVDDNKLNEKEVYYIKMFDTFKNGYNSTIGGDSGYILSDEARNKISNIHMGKVNSDETKRKISESVRKLYEDNNFKEDIRQRTIKAMKDSKVIERLSNSHKGYIHSEETKKRMSNSHSKLWIIESPSMEVFYIKNLKKFCRENNLSNSCMLNVSKGGQKTHKGWKCRRRI